MKGHMSNRSKKTLYIVGPDLGKLTNYAGTKFPRDVMKICENTGCNVVKLNEVYIPKNCYKFLGDLFRLIVTKKTSVVFYIDRVAPSLSRCLVYKFTKIKKQHLIPIIEDIDVLREPSDKADEAIKLLNQADVIISQNTTMTKYLKNKGISSKMISLGVLDFLSDKVDSASDNGNNHTIYYGGNLSSKQSGFIYQLSPSSDFKYRIYGGNLQKNIDKQNVEYCGGFSDDNCVGNIKGNWGLVWNGNSLYIDNNDTRSTYYNFVSPHKFSMYALCGLPVIVYEKAAIADFVIENNCGIVIKNLNEIEEKILKTSEVQYEEMKQNIKKIGNMVSNGNYLKNALKQLGF